MKIVFVYNWFTEAMGYSSNFIPKAMAALGHEVHVVTSNGQAYFTSPEYKEIFERFVGPGIVECGVKKTNGFMLHRLPFKLWPRRTLGIKGLIAKIVQLKPDIVHSGGICSEACFELAFAKPFLGYKLFTECHTHASVFPPFIMKIKTPQRWLYWHVYRPWVGKIVSAATEKCWVIGEDVMEITRDYFGFPQKKIGLTSLGVDTEMFRSWYESPIEQRRAFRQRLGFNDTHIVCIYTGRFQEGKDPLILARAIGRLVKEGKPYRGLFIGTGAHEYESQLKENTGCVFLPFVPVNELAQYYQAADIGVWPKQESTSQMDAASCGIPVVLSNRIKVLERVSGNGLLYEENNLDDLVAKLLQLQTPDVRLRMGEIGACRMRELFSWEKIVKGFYAEYEKALGSDEH